MNEEKKTEPGFFGWIRGQEVSRKRDGRWIAGVSAGIAERLGVDPLIVRAAFVVLVLLGGPGILLYVVSWVLLPNERGLIQLQELFRGRGSPWIVVLAVLFAVWLMLKVVGGVVIPFSIWSWSFLNPFGFSLPSLVVWIFWVMVVIAAGFVIHKAVLKHAEAAPRAESSGAQSFSNASANETQETRAFTQKMNDWGEDFGRKLDDRATVWSEKYADNHARFSLGAGHILISLALALIAAGAAVLVSFNYGFKDVWLVCALCAATVVLALSMMVAGVRGKKSGFVGFMTFVSGASLAIAAFFPTASSFSLIQNGSVDENQTISTVFAGRMNVSLEQFNANFKITDYHANLVFGDAYIQIPTERPTVVHVVVGAGEIETELQGETAFKSGVMRSETLRFNSENEGVPLNVFVRVGAGEVIVGG